MSVCEVMPWRATQPGEITVLTTRERRQRRLLTKRIAPEDVTGYDREDVFTVRAYRLDGPDDLPTLLAMLAGEPHSAPIRGMLKLEFAGRPLVLRRSRPRPGVPERFAPAARSWLMVDCDGMPRPPGIDPTDPITVGGALRRSLPPAFQIARCVVQLSSTAGLDQSVIKGHLWYWLDQPLTDAEAKRLLAGAPVDTSFYHPVGLQYCADPIFADGAEDPCIDGRLAILPGYPEVAVELAPERVRQAFTQATAAAYTAPRRGLGFRSTRSERYMLACLQAIAAAPAGSRHPTIVRIAARLYGLAKAGALDPRDVEARVRGAVNLSTFDRDQAEVISALEWAWEHAEPWRLP